MIQFRKDETGYVNWLDAHPDGFVVNSHPTPGPDYLVLHRVRCKTINRTLPPGHRWTFGYIKTCAASAEELRAWARLEVRAALQPCSLCQAPLG